MRDKPVIKIMKQKQGAALLTVLVIFFTLLVVVISTIMIASSNFTRSRSTNKFASSFYIAETGLNEFATLLDEIVIHDVTRVRDSNLLQKFYDKVQEYNPQLIDDTPKGVEFIVNYGTVMGSDASVHIQLLEHEDQFILTSTGMLGDSSRTLSQSFELVGTSTPNPPSGGTGDIILEETIFAKDSVVAIDLTGSLENPFGNGTRIPEMTGPIITNREYHPGNRVEIQSAFVTNNRVSMSDGMNLQGVLISSSDILINTSGGNSYLHTLVLKRDGSIHINIAYSSALNHIGYVLIPEEYKENVDEVITYEQNVSDYLVGVNKRAYDLLMSRVIFYKQDDFDPWNLSHYSSDSVVKVNAQVVNEIFRNQKDSADYSSYFALDFILDNLDDPQAVETVFPDVSIPSPPEINESTHYNTTGRDIEVGQSNSTFTLVTKNNEFAYTNSIAFNTSFNTLDLSEGTQTVYSFESFLIEAPSELNNALSIDVGSKDVMIVTKSLRIPNASFNIVGSGSLSFYVTGTGDTVSQNDIDLRIVDLGINGQVANTKKLSTKLNVFVGEARNADGSLVTVQVGAWSRTLAMTLYSQNLNVNFHSNFHGSFISLEGTQIDMVWVHIDSPLIYAPSAIYNGQHTNVGKFIVKNIQFSNSGSLSFSGGTSTELYHEVLNVILQTPSRPVNPDIPETPETPETPGTPGEPNITDGTPQSIKWGPAIEVGRSN